MIASVTRFLGQFFEKGDKKTIPNEREIDPSIDKEKFILHGRNLVKK